MKRGPAMVPCPCGDTRGAERWDAMEKGSKSKSTQLTKWELAAWHAQQALAHQPGSTARQLHERQVFKYESKFGASTQKFWNHFKTRLAAESQPSDSFALHPQEMPKRTSSGFFKESSDQSCGLIYPKSWVERIRSLADEQNLPIRSAARLALARGLGYADSEVLRERN